MSFAQTYVSGEVSGVWDSTGSPFYVTDSICVPSGDSLRIGPGVEVIFQGHYKFCVDSNAVLKAIGTAEDSIIFTAEDTTSWWQGIHFQYSSPECELSYCRITFSDLSGIRLNESNLTLSNSEIRKNRTRTGHYDIVDFYRGGGIWSNNSTLHIENCSITDNYARGFSTVGFGMDPYGGGIFCDNSIIEIRNSELIGNSVVGVLINGECPPEGGTVRGAAICAYNSEISLYGSRIIENTAPAGDGSSTTGSYIPDVGGGHAYGGGLYVSGGELVIDACFIEGNEASGGDGGDALTWSSEGGSNGGSAYGGGIFIFDAEAEIQNSIIEGNYASGGRAGTGSGEFGPGGGGSSFGGGIYSDMSRCELINSNSVYNLLTRGGAILTELHMAGKSI